MLVYQRVWGAVHFNGGFAFHLSLSFEIEVWSQGRKWRNFSATDMISLSSQQGVDCVDQHEDPFCWTSTDGALTEEIRDFPFISESSRNHCWKQGFNFVPKMYWKSVVQIHSPIELSLIFATSCLYFGPNFFEVSGWFPDVARMTLSWPKAAGTWQLCCHQCQTMSTPIWRWWYFPTAKGEYRWRPPGDVLDVLGVAVKVGEGWCVTESNGRIDMIGDLWFFGDQTESFPLLMVLWQYPYC